MRILCVIDNVGSGGAQRQLVNTALGLKARGHHVEFFSYYRDDFYAGVLDSASISVRVREKRWRFSLTPACEIRRLIRDNSIEGVLAFLDTPSVYAELACLGLQNVRVVVSERNTSSTGAVTIAKILKGLLHMRADRITTNCHTQRLWLERKLPWLRGRVTTIMNGVDLHSPRKKRRLSDGGALKMLGVGRITRQKNIPAFIEALALAVKEHDVDVYVDWAGRVDVVSEAAAAKDALEAHNLEKRWRWLGEVGDLPVRMCNYDALVLPSLWEGMPNAICEAFASGLPVLASNVSDNPILVEEGVRGFLFDPRKSEEIASAIVRFCRLSEDSRERMAQSARAYAEQKLSIDNLVDSYEKLLQERD